MASNNATTKNDSKVLNVLRTVVMHSTQQIIAGNPPVNFDGNALRNTFGFPLLVDEIRFEASGTGAGGQLLPVSAIPLSIRLSVNQHKLHNTFTPIMLNCKPNDRVCSGALGAGNNFWPTMGTSGFIEAGGVTWRLEKPITLMPNAVIAVDAQYQPLQGGGLSGGDPASPYTLSVAAVGRLVSRAPDRRWLPFVSSWVPDYTQISAVSVTPVFTRSKTADLYNPFQTPMFVKDVLGLGTVYNTAGSADPATNAVCNIIDTSLIGLATEGCNVQIINAGSHLSQGRAVVNTGIRDYVPFYHAFLPQTRSWRMNAVLQPRSHLQARLQQQNWKQLLALVNQAYDPTTFWARFAVAIVGYA